MVWNPKWENNFVWDISSAKKEENCEGKKTLSQIFFEKNLYSIIDKV